MQNVSGRVMAPNSKTTERVDVGGDGLVDSQASRDNSTMVSA